MHLQEFAENSVDFAHFQVCPAVAGLLAHVCFCRLLSLDCVLALFIGVPDCPLLQPLHGSMMVPWTNLTLPLLKVQHNAAWQPGTEEEGKHIAHFIDKPVLTIFGKEIPKSGADADITFVGASRRVVHPYRPVLC